MKKRIASIVLSVCLCLTLLPTAALATGSGHDNHCVCNDASLPSAASHTCTAVTNWQAWGETTSLPTSSGNYCLTYDVTITATWEPADGTVLCLNGHSITGKAGSPVIGVKSGVTFTLTDCKNSGTVTHQSDNNGYGVNVDHGTFALYAGKISGNGTGVNLNSGTFHMYGGSITGNNACGTSIGNFTGGGVVVQDGGTFKVSGNVQIKDNWYGGTKNADTGLYEKSSGTASNVMLTSSGSSGSSNTATITVTGKLTGGAGSIGVTTNTTPTDGSPQLFAQADSGYTLKNKDAAAFTPDLGTDNYHIELDKTNNQLKLYAGAAPAHTHNWTYTASDESITAKCTKDGCSTSGTVTINASDTTYDGEPKAATLDNQLPDGVTEPTIKYCKNNPEETPLDGAPTNAGKYKASIKLGTVGISKKFTISPKSITVKADNITLSGDSFTYTGNEIKPTVTVKDGDTTIPENEYTVTYSNNINAGTGSVTVKAGGNYSFNQVTKNFTITAKSLTSDMVQVTGSLTYDGTQQSPTVTIKDGDRTLELDTDYTLDVTPQTNAGSYTLTITGKGNYDGSLNDNPWSIAPKPVTVEADTYKVSKVYDGTTSVGNPSGALSISGILPADSGVFVNPTIGTYSNANVGTGTVNVDLAISGDTNNNYQLTSSSVTVPATITPKSITPSIEVDGTYTYTGSEIKPKPFVKDGSNPLTLNTDYTLSYENNINAGNTAKVIVTAKDGGNYTWSPAAEKTFTITRATYGDKTATGSAKYGSSGEVDLSGYKAAGGTFGTVTKTDDNNVLSGDPYMDGDTLKFTFVNEPTKADKTATIKVNVTSANYASYTITVTVTVNAKTPQDTLTIHASKTTVTYGETVTLSYEGGSGNGAVNYTITDGAVSLVGDKLTLKQVGNITVMASKAEDDDYAAIDSESITITVSKATVTVTALDRTIYVNGTAPDLSNPVKGTDYTVTGLVGADTLDGTIAMEYQKDGSTVATPDAATTGSYDIVISGVTADSTKYNDVVFKNGTLTISNRPSSGGGSSSSGTTITVPVSSDHASVNVKAEVSKGNATVEVSNKQIEKVAADGAGDVTIDVSGLKNVESATVPSHVVEKINEAENTGLTVSLPAGSVTLDETALGSVTENADGRDVTVSVVAVPTEKLSTAVKDIIGMEPTVLAVVDVNVTISGKKQSSFDGGKVTISVPYTPKAGEDTSKLTVWFIRDDGTIENKGGYYDAKNKCFVFETDHLSQYILVNTNEMQTFVDVPTDAYFANAVSWAAGKGITGGVDATHFMPHNACTRAQIVTFLWRAAGSLEPKAASSFTDVSADAYYAKAVAWAVENGITGGIGNNQFAPDLTCTRAQAAAFLFRYAAANGMETVTLQELVGGYGDAAQVPGYALPAFNWALAKGIVNGNNGNLMPNNDCTRAQIVTMLYRLLGTN